MIRKNRIRFAAASLIAVLGFAGTAPARADNPLQIFANLFGVGGEVYFGDDSSRWASDGECDDSRFVGSGRSVITSDDHRYADATDCRALFNSGDVRLADNSLANPNFNQSMVGEITHADSMRDGKHYVTYTFYGAVGQEVAIDLHSSDFDTFLELRTADGRFYENDDSTFLDVTHSRLVVTLTETGTHEITVTTYGADSVGDFTLDVQSEIGMEARIASTPWYFDDIP